MNEAAAETVKADHLAVSLADTAQTRPLLTVDMLQDSLKRSERDLLATQERLARAMSECSQASKQTVQLELHVAALEAELRKLRDDALLALSAGRAEKAALCREIAHLTPRAQSNTAALRALADMKAEREAAIQSADSAKLTTNSKGLRLPQIKALFQHKARG